MKGLARLSKWLERYIEWIGVVLLSAITIIVAVEVVARYGFRAFSMLRGELSQLLLCIVCFLSYGYIWKRRRHIMLDVLFLHFGQRVQRGVWFLSHILGLFLGALWLWCGIEAIQFELFIPCSSIAGIPFIWHYYILVAGAILLLFHIAEGLCGLIRKPSHREL